MNRPQAEEQSRLRLYLRENGCPVQPESRHSVIPPELVIEQVSVPMMNTAFDLESSGAGYILDAHLISNRARPIRIAGVQIKPPWEGSCISLLKDDPRYRTSGGYYVFPSPGDGFPESEVLNSLLSGKGKLNPGGDVEGLIMATDFQPIPDDVADRGQIVVKVTVFDGAGNGFSSGFRLLVDRSAIRARKVAEEIRASFQSPPNRTRALIGSRNKAPRKT
jgi:hypothetical protein